MKLKQSDRTKMLEDILRDAFADRFQKMHDAVNEEFKEFVARDHSAFLEALGDPKVKAWGDYTEAQSLLSSLLSGYTTVERLLADFPEYNKYIPEMPPAKNLPAVVVGELRGKLSVLGVPVE